MIGVTSGQSCKHFTVVNYDSRVVLDWNPYYDPRVVIYERKMFIRLATDFAIKVSPIFPIVAQKSRQSGFHLKSDVFQSSPIRHRHLASFNCNTWSHWTHNEDIFNGGSFLAFFFFITAFSISKCSIKFTNGWFRTWVLWCRKRLLYQLCHNQYQANQSVYFDAGNDVTEMSAIGKSRNAHMVVLNGPYRKAH